MGKVVPIEESPFWQEDRNVITAVDKETGHALVHVAVTGYLMDTASPMRYLRMHFLVIDEDTMRVIAEKSVDNTFARPGDTVTFGCTIEFDLDQNLRTFSVLVPGIEFEENVLGTTHPDFDVEPSFGEDGKLALLTSNNEDYDTGKLRINLVFSKEEKPVYGMDVPIDKGIKAKEKTVTLAFVETALDIDGYFFDIYEEE